MPTSEGECLAALIEAAEQLGESPTKPQYEDLGLTPAASTILRVIGGWNEAKERAGLATNASRGSRVATKPDHVEIPDDSEWANLTQDQRWHYRNAEWNSERTLRRRTRLRQWVNDRKSERGCADCGESDPACLDFHHEDSEQKEMAVAKMVTYGHGRDSLRDEMERCEVLCANCHQKRHGTTRFDRTVEEQPSTKRKRLQSWSAEYRQKRGCQRCSENNPACLQFHHPDPTEKTENVGELIARSASADRVRAEVQKCLVLCANCHRREHFEPPTEPGS